MHKQKFDTPKPLLAPRVLHRLLRVRVGLTSEERASTQHAPVGALGAAALTGRPTIVYVTTVPTGIELDAQYRAMREATGLLDRSERAKLLVEGPDAAEYLQSQLTNDVEALEPGAGCYAALLDRKGRMQADLRVLRLTATSLWLDAEPAGSDALERHLELYQVGREVELRDVMGEHAILSLIGPGAGQLCAGAPRGPEHTHAELNVGGIECRAVVTDVGIDLIAPASDAEALGAGLISAGAESVSPAAAEIVRVETGRPRFGAEITTSTIPEEAGLNDRAVSLTKGCYIGQETVARLHYKGRPNRHLRGLRLDAEASNGAVVRLGDRDVGELGSAVLSPALGPIGLAILRREATPGDEVLVDQNARAEVVELPFAEKAT